MSEPLAPPSQSLIAGKYQLGELIGRGGMGSVWEGRHVSLGTRVAVKFIEREYADSQEARQRFDNEARAAATIRSKYAVQIYDHGVTDDGRPYIVMERLDGEGLEARVERLGKMPLTDTARILMQVCRALQRAHDGGIIHRDLKLENIFLHHSPDEDEETAKVLDFGIAKIRAVDGTTLSASTKTGAVLGTPFYMSPEQARGLRDIDHRTDLWSLGVIAYKCVIGTLPFEGQSLGDLLVKICTAPLPVPSQVEGSLPPSFDAWFARALERDPAARFSSALELADALAFAAGLSVRRNPTSVPQPAPTSRPVAEATTGASPLGVTSAPLTATSPGVARRSGAGVGLVVAAVTLALGAGGAVVMLRGNAKVAPPTAAAPPPSSSTVAAPPAAPTNVAPPSATTTTTTTSEATALTPLPPEATPTAKTSSPPAGKPRPSKPAKGKPEGTAPKSDPEPAKTKPPSKDPGF